MRRVFPVIVAVLTALDIATTLWGLTHGLREQAPLMSMVVDNFGVGAIAPLRIFLTIIIYALLLRINTRPLLAWVVVIAIFVQPVVQNILLIQGL